MIYDSWKAICSRWFPEAEQVETKLFDKPFYNLKRGKRKLISNRSDLLFGNFLNDDDKLTLDLFSMLVPNLKLMWQRDFVIMLSTYDRRQKLRNSTIFLSPALMRLFNDAMVTSIELEKLVDASNRSLLSWRP